MILVSGHFRLPAERIAEARTEMAAVIAASLAEDGCRAYSYAEDVTQPGLFRVHEEWDSRPALNAHFDTPHMKHWQATREKLGFADRRISVYEIASATPL